MASSITTKIDIKAIEIKIANSKVDTEKSFQKGVELALSQILIDVSKGINESGGGMKGYSQSHLRTRKEKGLPLSPVDHFFTGKMLRSLATRVFARSKDSLTVAIFPDAQQAAKVRNTDKLRNWFGFSERAISAIRKALG